MMKWWMVVVVVLAGCSGRTEGPQPSAGSVKVVAPAPVAPEDPVKALVAKADRALLDAMKLDYRRPFVTEPLDLAPVRALFFKACQAGDHRSCWMTRAVARVGMPEGDAEDAQADEIVKKNCLAGDAMSCRAMKYEPNLPGDPGHIAIADACYGPNAKACDYEGLRRECHAGYPRSCSVLAHLQPKRPDLHEILATAYKLAHEGCRLGILSECEILHGDILDPSSAPIEDRRLALEQECTLRRAHCDDLGELYLAIDPAKARDAFERQCELSTFHDMQAEACARAWRAYTDPTSGIPEPVPGRAKQLHDWACKKHKVCWKCESCVEAPPPAAVSMPPAAVKDLVARADEALADSTKLDYRLPFSNHHVDREPIRAMYFQACQAGDHRACWMTTNIAVPGARMAYEDQANRAVRDNCLAGDVMSCRAASFPGALPGDPAHVFLSYECNGGRTCDFVAMRRECKAGFPESCFSIVEHDLNAADLAELGAMGRKAAREGCALGLTNECDLLSSFASTTEERQDKIFGLEQICTMELQRCGILGLSYELSDPVKRRDALERACQWQDLNGEQFQCEYTWRAYTDPKSGITEPVPGRAKQLRDWACKKYKTCWKR